MSKEIAIKNAAIQGIQTNVATSVVADEALGNNIQNPTGTLGNIPVVPGSVVFQDPDTTAEDLVDNGDGTFSSATDGGIGTIDYKTGIFDVTFGVAPGATNNVVDYRHGTFRNYTVQKNRVGFGGNSAELKVTDNDTDDVYNVRLSVEKVTS